MRPRLDVKLWIYASVATFVLLSLASYVERVLTPAPVVSASGMSPAETTMMSRLVIYAGRLIFGLVFTYVYFKGYEQKAWFGEGLRYGICMAILVALPNLVYTLLAPAAPSAETTGPLVRNVVQLLLAGPLVALIYRPKAATPAA
jgi:hypothetical protein